MTAALHGAAPLAHLGVIAVAGDDAASFLHNQLTTDFALLGMDEARLAAYCTAKAAELHLARCLALEGAPAGIRVNVVNPDAVLRGSRIWQGEWAQQRAEQYKTSTDELESIYRERSLLKRSVFPEDVAEAVAFFASERASKSTGNIINVDAGNAAAFTR